MIYQPVLQWGSNGASVERALAGVVENPESFVVGAKLVCLNIEFQKQGSQKTALPEKSTQNLHFGGSKVGGL
jgi:hypothetical protein